MKSATAWLPLSAILLAQAAAGQTAKESSIATLYRSSTVIEYARIHVATFDANTEGGSKNSIFSYNWGNCLIAAELFEKQPGVKVRYWCEKGRYRK